MARTVTRDNTRSTSPSSVWDVAKEVFNDGEMFFGVETKSKEASDGAILSVRLHPLPEGKPWVYVDVREFGSDEDLIHDGDFQIQTTLERLRLLVTTLQEAIERIDRLAEKHPGEVQRLVARELRTRVGPYIYLDR